MLLILFSATFIGISLGLLGSGGAVLTVPILIFGFQLDEKVAIASALAIVALISLFSSINNYKQQLIDWKSLNRFIMPSLIGSYIGAVLGAYVSNNVQLIVFSLVMLIAGIKMLKPVKTESKPVSNLIIVTVGLLIGIITGFVGVGGGFLIVPAFIILLNLPLKNAVATSLVLIFANSSIAFCQYFYVFSVNSIQLNWILISTFSGFGILGSYLGQILSNKLNTNIILKIFAWVLVILSLFTFYQGISGG